MKREFMRWYNRGFTNDRKKTSCTTQEEYEGLYKGTDFDLSNYYSSMFTTLLICFFFSPAMPILYIICAFSLTLQFWFAKLKLLRFNQKPPIFGEGLAINSRWFFLLAVLIHVVGTLAIYRQSPVFHKLSEEIPILYRGKSPSDLELRKLQELNIVEYECDADYAPPSRMLANSQSLEDTIQIMNKEF